MEGCSSSITAFCMQLRSYCLQLEASCATLRASVNHPRSSLPSPNLGSLPTALIDRVSSTSDAVENLESKTTGTISFEELLGHSMEVYKLNEANISVLEERLKEYGYMPVPELLMANDEPEELSKSSDHSELSLDSRHLMSSHGKEINTALLNVKKPSSVVEEVPERLGSCTYGQVKEQEHYAGALSLHDLGLSAAGLACLAEADSSPGVYYSTSLKSPEANLAIQENALSTNLAVVEDERDGGDVPCNDVPFFKPVDEYEYLSCPTWLKIQLSFEDLHDIMDGMYDVLAKKRTNSHACSTLTQEDIAAINAGTKMKPCLLLLVKLNRLRTGHENGATVYHVVCH